MTALSPREREIVELVGGDLSSYPAVAKRLQISVHTVRSHVYRIVEKVGGTRPARATLIELHRREFSVDTSGGNGSGD